MKAIFALATVLAALSSTAWAESGGDRTFARMEEARTQAMQNYNEEQAVAQAKQYHSAKSLDIAKVVSITPDDGCGVVPVTMRYLDSKGAEQSIEYQTERQRCTGTN